MMVGDFMTESSLIFDYHVHECTDFLVELEGFGTIYKDSDQ